MGLATRANESGAGKWGWLLYNLVMHFLFELSARFRNSLLKMAHLTHLTCLLRSFNCKC